ncbi:hypothetical protein GOV12_07720 [Candidatus Pacearchaeota archaeon]|nr:hypothetical protein [Candidatus Pacearchaeota archaeon]
MAPGIIFELLLGIVFIYLGFGAVINRNIYYKHSKKDPRIKIIFTFIGIVFIIFGIGSLAMGLIKLLSNLSI